VHSIIARIDIIATINVLGIIVIATIADSTIVVTITAANEAYQHRILHVPSPFFVVVIIAEFSIKLTISQYAIH